MTNIFDIETWCLLMCPFEAFDSSSEFLILYLHKDQTMRSQKHRWMANSKLCNLVLYLIINSSQQHTKRRSYRDHRRKHPFHSLRTEQLPLSAEHPLHQYCSESRAKNDAVDEKYTSSSLEGRIWNVWK